METRIRIATPFGTDFQIVPHFLSAQPVWPFRDKATMSLHYPRVGVNDALLNSECEAVFEYHNGTQWVEPLDSRYKLAGRDNDRLEDVPTRRFDFIALLPEMLEHAKVWEPAGLQTDTDGNILFAAVTPGVIIKTLFDNARGRGWGPQLNLGFSTTHDSNGQPWAGVVNLALDPAQSIFEVLSALGNQGIVDWAGQGRTLQMYNPDTYLGRDLQSVRLLAYDGETSAPTQVSYRDRATVLRVVGDGGNNWDRPNGTSPWGRLESIMSAGGVSDEGTAFLMSDEELLKASAARVSRTREFDGVSQFLPHRDFRGGDHVRYQTENGVEKMRVFSMSLTIDDRLSGYAVLGDRFEDALIAAARKQQRITVGKVNGGNGKPPTQPTDDVRTPANPLGFIMSSSVYLNPEDGTEVGRVHAGWTHTGKATDGTAMDIDRFEFRTRESLEAPGNWQSFRSVEGSDRNATFSPVRVRRADGAAETYDFQIRAVGANSRYSAWVTYKYLTMETDTTPPPVPSAPVVEAVYGAVSYQWDGLGAGGELMPPDFLNVEAEIGSTPEGEWFLAGTLERAGSGYVPFSLEYGTYWLRLRSVDRTGNKSEWSALGEVTTTPLVDLPDIHDLVDSINTQIQGVRESANGANTRVDSVEDPSVRGGEKDGDSWFKWVEGAHPADPKILIGQWTWMGGRWEAVEMGHQVLASIDLGRATVGFLDGIFIKAGSVNAGALLVGDFTNLATLNPDLKINTTIPAANLTETVGNRARKAAGGNDRLAFMNPLPGVPVEAGDWVRISFNAATTTGAAVIPKIWIFSGTDGTGAVVEGAGNPLDLTPGGREYSVDVKVPTLAPVGGGVSWYAGLDGPGIRSVSIRTVRVYKKMNATLIGPDSIDTPHLRAGAVDTPHLKANAVEADKLAFGFADGKVITGALMQTVAAASRGIKIDGLANRIYAWSNTGSKVFDLNGDNGDIILGKNGMIRMYGNSGNVDIGNGKLTIDGGTGHLRIDVGNEGGHAIVMRGDDGRTMQQGADANGGYIGFSVPSFFGAGVLRLEETNDAITLRSPRPTSTDEAGYIRLFPGYAPGAGDAPVLNTNTKLTFTRADGGVRFLNGARIDGDAVMRITSGASIYIAAQGKDASNATESDLQIYTDEVGRYVRSYTVYNREYSASSNMYITASGYIGRTTSKSANKLDQRPLDVSDDVLDIPMRTWLDRSETLEREELKSLGVRTATQQTVLDQKQRRIPGMIAEEVAEKAPVFVTYNSEGELEGFDRDILALAQIAVLSRRLKALESKIN